MNHNYSTSGASGATMIEVLLLWLEGGASSDEAGGAKSV